LRREGGLKGLIDRFAANLVEKSPAKKGGGKTSIRMV